VKYGCDSKPTVAKTMITGFNQVGFIISSEYEVNCYVNESTKNEWEKCKCCTKEKKVGTWTYYEIQFKCFIYLKAGLGFGLGGGTGTLGFKSLKETAIRYGNTDWICCPD